MDDSNAESRFDARKIRGLPRGLGADAFNYEICVDVGITGSHETAELYLHVCTPEALEVGADGVVSERAQLVVATMDAARIRAYLLALVRHCQAATLREGVEVLTRYFRAMSEPDEPGPDDVRHVRRIELRGLDPPWIQHGTGNDVHLTFGVGEHGHREEVELTLAIATPAALRARDAAGAFVLAHRATLIVAPLTMDAVHTLIVDIVERRCDAPSLAHALPLLQRYFRLEWETSLTHGIDV